MAASAPRASKISSFSGLDHRLDFDACRTAARRLVGVAPLFTLGLAAGLAVSTVYHGWMYPTGFFWHGQLELVVFCVEVLCLVVSYVSAVLIGPGFVPKGWQPTQEELQTLLHTSRLGLEKEQDLPLRLSGLPPVEDLLQYCQRCHGYKPPRAHHCSSCGRCALSMDHHCPWTNTCVGFSNFRAFVQFVHFVPLATLHSVYVHSEILVIVVYAWYKGSKFNDILRVLLQARTICALLAWFVALAVMLLVGTLACEMQHTLRLNVSMIEEFVIEKAVARRQSSRQKQFMFPYDLGRSRNVAAVLGKSRCGWLGMLLPGGRTPGEPVWHELRAGSGHFDLSTEQLAQKAHKLGRSVMLPVQMDFQGEGRCCLTYWCWICCRFGWCTFCCCQTCGENRLTVKKGDEVLVNSFEDDWVYGRVLPPKKGDQDEVSTESRLDGPLGWLPRLCLDGGEPRPFLVPHQQELQGSWLAPENRVVVIKGLIAYCAMSRLPFVLKETGDSVSLLGCQLKSCDGKIARWSNGESWTKKEPQKSLSGATYARGGEWQVDTDDDWEEGEESQEQSCEGKVDVEPRGESKKDA